jgi:hypothetical protein
MAVFLSPVGGVAAQFFTNTGAVLTGGKIYTYAAGTTTPLATYTSAGGSNFWTNPIVLDAAGRVPNSGEIWLADGVQYKFVLKDSNDVLIATYDNILGINASFSNFIASEEIQVATAGQTVFTLSNPYVPGANTLSVFVDGVNQYDGSSYSYVETNSITVTFASGLHVGALVKFTTVQTLTTTQATTAALVTYNEGGTGAITYTVQAKLRQYISVKDFGAVGNGSTNDTAALQAAISATPSGGILYFPPGDYITSAALQISQPITLQGSDKNASVILCLANDGIQINKNNSVNIFNLELAQAVRYTTTPNSYTGILISGDNGTRPSNHCYRDVYIDGFLYGVYADYIWSSVFDNVRTAYGVTGLRARYLCVNNVVTNSSFTGNTTGYGIFIDGLGAGTEGWMISNTLTYRHRSGIYGKGATHVYISNCILDYSYESGILISDDTLGNFGGNWSISNNYIAIANTGAFSSIAGVHIANTVSNSQNRGCQISNNHILTYGGNTCPYGIYADTAQAVNNAITGNSVTNFSTNDIFVGAIGGTVTGNTCLSAITDNINGLGLIANNTGTVYYRRAVNYASIGLLKITYDEAVPTAGTWNRGDICYKVNPSAGGVPGWVCVSGGTPGTWKAMAALAA